MTEASGQISQDFPRATTHTSRPSLGRPFGHHDSQIAVTLGAGTAHIFCHSVLSLFQAFVHHDPSNLQPEPFCQFFYADGEPLKALAFIIRLPIEGSAAQCGINPQCISLHSLLFL